MKELRVLFTGVGRRIELIQAFRNDALRLDIDLTVFGAELDMSAPALAYCDYARKVCRMKDDNYIPELVEICKKDKIDLLIPTIDTDLLLLSKNVSKFTDTKVLVSHPDKIAICRDKNKTSDFFVSCDCFAPEPVNDWRFYKGDFPCFIKPKDGSGSINAFKVASVEELEMYAHQIEDYIVQPFIAGQEYTVDIFCDFDGQPLYITPRIRSQVRAGEVLKTQISMDEKIIEECKRIIERFKPVGPLTIQLIRQKGTNKDYFIEINPRFGGGAPLSMKAGARSAEALMCLMLQKDIDSKPTISDGAIYCRFDQSVCVQKGENKQPIKGAIFDFDLFFSAVKQNSSDAEREAQIAEIRNLISDLRSRNICVGVIADSAPSEKFNWFSATESNPMVDDVIVADDLGGKQFRKPCDIAFRIMQRKWNIPFEQIVYVGANENTNFLAPRQLGMQWIEVEESNWLCQEDDKKVLKFPKSHCF